ncbi:MAG: amino acid permease [Candidatus Latescibacteria bacterium]|nr:amino acid permease [Candidatus Latescibacterota bacterium]
MLHHARRPRNVNSSRAAAMLYGDWGTSKAYVTGIAFALAGYTSLYLIIGMAVLTAIVGTNYIWICKYYPDGGGVYSSVRHRSRTLAVIGALLLVADYVVTAALSSLDAFHYLGVANPEWWAIGAIILIGLINTVGPKHSGELAIFLALPAVLVVLALVAAAIPHLHQAAIQPPTGGLTHTWLNFVGIILALSGVEAIANMTGVMRVDPDSTDEHPSVHKTARRAILPVLLEVTLMTVLLGWAMHAIPNLSGHTEDMLRFMGQYYVGDWFARIVSVVFALLLLSASNTALVDLIAVMYSMSRDREMPFSFSRLNTYGVPWLPLIVATALPVIVLTIEHDLERLAALYAIGVIGAITINLGSCSTNRHLPMPKVERVIMGGTFVLLTMIELTIAYEKRHALIFAAMVLTVGLITRSFARRFRPVEQAMTLEAPVLRQLQPFQRAMATPVSAIMVAVRGVTETLRFAIEEARLRDATLYVLFVREIAIREAVDFTLDQDPTAQAVFTAARQLADGVPVIPLYCVSDDAAGMILDQAATLGVDYLIVGSSARGRLVHLLRGNVIQEVADKLPEEIRLIIHG